MAASPWWRILPAVPAQLDRPDPVTGYGHRENTEGLWLRENRVHVRMNAQGLRDRPRDDEVASGVVRVAVAGDSITEALQVEERDLFTLRAERMLQARHRPVEVLNFGLSGALPLQQLLFVVHRGLPMGIDAAFFVFNARDLASPLMANDSILPAYVENSSGELVIGRAFRQRRSHQLADHWIGHAFFWLVDHSLVANALYVRAKLDVVQAAAPAEMGAQQGETCAAIAAAVAEGERLWGQDVPQGAARRLARFLADVPVMLEGRPAVFVLSGFGRPDDDCQGERQRRRALVDVVRTRLDRAGIGFVDLDAAIAQKLGDQSEYQRMFGFGRKLGRGHLNERGHAVYAQVLTDAIEALLPTWTERQGR